MSKENAKEIAEKLLSLSVDDRSYIIERLMVGLDEGEDLQNGDGVDKELNLSSEWIDEISNRIKDFEDGCVELLDSDSVVENIREKLRQKHAHRTAS